MKVIITREDVLSSKNFMDTTNCPLAKKMKELLNTDKISVGTEKITDGLNQIGRIHPPFEHIDYLNLRDGVIEEFITEYTPY